MGSRGRERSLAHFSARAFADRIRCVAERAVAR
jgi:hypothetical protein